MPARKQLRWDNQPQASTPNPHKASASFGIESIISTPAPGEISGFALLDADSTLNLEMSIDNPATATTNWDNHDIY